MKQILFIIAFLLSSHLFGQNSPDIIDFEIDTVNSENRFIPKENQKIDNSFFIKHYGVSFHLGSVDSHKTLKIAQVGAPVAAFVRDYSESFNYNNKVWTTTCDIPHDFENFGDFFLTNAGLSKGEYNNVYINFRKGMSHCSKASGYLIDIDGPERWIIRAYSKENGKAPDVTLSFCVKSIWSGNSCNEGDVGDGMGTYWELDISPNTLDYIEFEYDNSKDPERNAGFAFDNFRFCSHEKNQIIYIEKSSWDSITVGSSIVLDNVEFKSNKSDLLSSSFNELNRLYDYLKKHPEQKVEISGHTDNMGDKNSNQRLSEDRAKSVVDYLLLLKGMVKDRFIVVGYGDSQPLINNETEENRQRNRRVEFKIIE